MKRGRIIGLVGVTLVAFAALFWWLLKDAQLHVLDPTGQVAMQQRNLIVFTVALSLIVVIPVFTMMIAFAWKYTEKNKKAVYKPEWSHNNLLEFIWWGIPVVIIGILAVVTWVTSHSLDPYRPITSHQKPIEVQVVALQWKWLFIYPEHNVAFLNELPVVKDRPVHFTLSADAPMSAFWIPTLGSQIYSMNGMHSQLNLVANKEGDYYGYNTNINGEGYASMRFAVKVRDQKNFDETIKKAHASPNVLSEESYRELAQKVIQKDAVRYRLANKELYDQIVMKYMHGNMPAGTTVPADSHDATMEDHSMHNMEGM
jgi:cytochrome o ubiquinol oxidase subunit 2